MLDEIFSANVGNFYGRRQFAYVSGRTCRNSNLRGYRRLSCNSIAKNNRLTKDEIITVAGTILKITSVRYEVIPINDAAGIAKYRAIVIAEIDTATVDAAFEKWLNRDGQEKSSLTQQTAELQRIIDEQNKRIAELEALVRQNGANRQQVREEVAAIDNETLYAQKLDEAQKLAEAAQYAAAVKLYTEAISLKSDSAYVYFYRGYCYGELKQYERAIQDFEKAIALNPNFTLAKNNREACLKAMGK